jgi:hypothetical protein
MSGPKSTRYTLTLEQRRILAEARERERKTQQELERLRAYKTEISIIKSQLLKETTDIDMLVERTNTGVELQTQIKETLNQLDKSMNIADSVNKDSGLERLQQANNNILNNLNQCRKVKKKCDVESKNIKDTLSEDINNSIIAGMNISTFMENRDTNPINQVEQQREKIKEVLDSLDELKLSDDLKTELDEICSKSEEITDKNFIDNYYAMTVLPFVKKCKEHNELVSKYGEEFDELVSKHRFYSNYLGLPILKFAISTEQLEFLRLEVKQLEQQYEQVEEQSYIAKSVDEVMVEMGYNVVGNREVTKKNGKKFRNELYHFSEGTVVNVTYASNGQISMELDGVDNCDREPTNAECNVLCEEMSEFCGEFQEIEKRLKEKGVILANRISMLPPVSTYAQIINVNDYDMNKSVECLEVISKRKNESRNQTMRKE